MSWGVSFPSDQILLLFVVCPIAENLFDFPLWLSFYEVRWGFQEVWAVGRCFIIWGQEGCVEHIVDLSCIGEFEAVGNVGYLGDYF
jgi:hypothetical protein